MGFGKKTDFRQAKEFDLDKTYRSIIKPAVVRAGLTCVRADEELGAGLDRHPHVRTPAGG